MKKGLIYALIIGILLISLIFGMGITNKKPASHLMRAVNFKTEMNIPKVTFQYKKDGVWTDVKTDVRNTSTFSFENLEFKVGPVYKIEKNVELTITNEGYFNRIININGDYIVLPNLSEFPVNKSKIYIYDSSGNIKATHNFYWVNYWNGYSYQIEQNISGDSGLFNLTINENNVSVACKNCPLKDSIEEINLLYGSHGNFTGTGYNTDNRFPVSDTKTIIFDGDTDDYFIASAEGKTEINWTIIIALIIIIILLLLLRKYK